MKNKYKNKSKTVMNKERRGTNYTQKHLYADILHYYISQCRSGGY